MESVDSWGQPMSSNASMAFDYCQPGSATVIHGRPPGHDSSLELARSTHGDGQTGFYYPNNTYHDAFHSPSDPASALASPTEYGHIQNPFFQSSLTPGGTAILQHHQYAMYQHFHQQSPLEPQFPGSLRVQTHHFQSEHNSPGYGNFTRPTSAGFPGNDDGHDNDFDPHRRPSRSEKARRASRFSDASEVSRASTILSPVSVQSSVSSPRTTISAPARTRQQQYERTRQKNREAASKCREKTKNNVDDLRARERELSCQKQVLTAIAGELKNEVLALKHEILLHGNCECEYIQKYLESAAKQIA